MRVYRHTEVAVRSVMAGLITVIAAGAAVERQLSAQSQRPTFRAGVELVVVRVTVVGADNRPMTGLTKDDFVVLENGVAQPVRHFLSSDVPVDVALLLDTSSSMRPKLPKLRATAATFLNSHRPGDRGLVASFNDRIEILANLTGDRQRLQHAVERLYARGNTSLYDGMYITLGSLSSASRDAARRQALVVLSDGRDTESNLGLEDVRRQAIESGVPIYPILLIDHDIVAVRRLENRLELFDFIEVARESGGQVFRVDETTDLKQAYALIARELSTQYVLAYAAADGNGAGASARVEVRIPSQPAAEARAHVGYTNRSRAFLEEAGRGNHRSN
jgi:Ca-activated chloride channel family protein